MEIIIKAYLIKGIDNIEEFQIRVNEVNYKLVRLKLESEYENIINLFKQMKEQGLIKSIYIPKNKRLKGEIIKLIKVKRDIKRSITKIREIFRNS